jgi:transcriptional regulator with XRE-family HTH domain
MKTIADKLKAMRARFGLSPADLAKQAEVDPSFISKLESGTGTLTLKSSKALSKGFGLTLKDFMDEMGLFEDTTQPSFELISSALRRNGYTNTQAKQIIEYARFIKAD